MNQSFADRLARIEASQASPGASATTSAPQTAPFMARVGAAPAPADPHPAPKSYEQRFWMQVINNVILGAIWIGISAYCATRFGWVVDGFVGAEATAEARMNMQVALGVALAVSFGLYYWVVRQALRDLGKADGMPASLALGGALGALVGAGPTALIELATQAGYI